MLKWDKVAFTPHRRFLELFGFSFAGDVQYVGTLHHDGQRLAPADLFQIYGAESWRRGLFWENGSDFADQRLIYSGEHGFNCTPLVQRGSSSLKWESLGFGSGSGWRSEFSTGHCWFGDVCHDEAMHWLLVDLEQGQFAWNVHTGPYIVSPDEPYGQ